MPKPMKITPMARAFFRHYEHKHQLMKQYLGEQVPAPVPPSEQPRNFSTGFSGGFS